MTNTTSGSTWEIFLIRLRHKLGRVIHSTGNRVLLLDDPSKAWIVTKGTVYIFANEQEEDLTTRSRSYLFQVNKESMFMGIDPQKRPYALIASAAMGTELIEVPWKNLQTLGQKQEMTGLIVYLLENWIEALSATLPNGIPPKTFIPLDQASEAAGVSPGDVIGLKKGVRWVHHITGESRIAGNRQVAPVGNAIFFPLAHTNWLIAESEVSLLATTTHTILMTDATWHNLELFHQRALECIVNNLQNAEQAEFKRLSYKQKSTRAKVTTALLQLAAPLNPDLRQLPAEAETPDVYLSACQIIGRALGVRIQKPPETSTEIMQRDPVLQIARASRLRTRRVALRDDWWRHDNGPLLATVDKTKALVVLLPEKGHYILVDPTNLHRTPVNEAVASLLEPFAIMFYRPLPERPLTPGDLARYSFFGGTREVLSVLGMGLAVGAMALLVPLMTAQLFNTTIPQNDTRQVWLITLALVVSAVAAALFQLVRSLALLRIEGRIDASLQAAVWDRVLNLPVRFFRDYTAGDLGLRAMGISIIRQTLSGLVINAVLSSLFSGLSLLLLFYYDVGLAVVTLGLVLVVTLITLILGYWQVRQQRVLVELEGRISSLVLQFITGITKFRVAGAEDRAFAYWASRFAKKRRVTYRTRLVQNAITTFNAAYPVLMSAVLFGMVAASSQRGLSTGDFLAFNAAFGQVALAGVTFTAAVISILSMVPVYERLEPILATTPEVNDLKNDPGELTGHIEVSHVSFRYRHEEPMILRNVSLEIAPGEFVALIGPSGSGKSTLFRLMLGMEAPETGTIYYDNKDLAELDIQALRQQLGIVLQQSRVLPGDFLSNIVGSSPLTVDDAWEAARLAGLDEDIRQMPMGMFTVISQGGSNLSGGQRQRLLIARAVANRPRMVFFDEATSALDNRTQEIVSRSLENLNATRIVIAHRLSTIINADRIVEMQNGEIVQMGKYQELIKAGGLFADLAKRQQI